MDAGSKMSAACAVVHPCLSACLQRRCHCRPEDLYVLDLKDFQIQWNLLD